MIIAITTSTSTYWNWNYLFFKLFCYKTIYELKLLKKVDLFKTQSPKFTAAIT
jgi:hypothetical protein